MIPQIHYRVTYVYAVAGLGAVLQKCVYLTAYGRRADVNTGLGSPDIQTGSSNGSLS